MSNFSSLSEDHQDLANKFPKKTDEVLGGNRLRSSIVWNVESLKEKFSLLQSKYLSVKTIDCII